MKNRKIFYICVLFMLAMVITPLKSYAIENDMLSFVSYDADIVASFQFDLENKGISYLTNLFKAKRINQQRESKIDAKMQIIEILKNKNLIMQGFVSAEEQLCDYSIAVKIDDKKKREEMFSLLPAIIKKRVQPQKTVYLGYEIYNSIDRHPQDISSIAMVKNVILLSSDIKTIERTIDVYKGKTKNISDNKMFNKVYSRFDGKYNVFMFLSNENSNLVKVLRAWEKENYITVLLSAEALDAVGVYFKFIDENNVNSKITFLTRKKASLFDNVQDDARFFNEILRRKISFEHGSYESDISVFDNFVDLDIKVNGLMSLWSRVIGRKFVLSKGLNTYESGTPIKETRIEETADGKTVYIDDIGDDLFLQETGSETVEIEAEKSGLAKIFFVVIGLLIFLGVLKFIVFKK